jgi:Ceramidase
MQTQKLLTTITIIAFAILFIFVKPIPQSIIYHCFANDKVVLGIHHFYNVVSNIGFVCASIYGFFIIKKYDIKNVYAYVLCIGLMLTGIGSAYYHYNPNNNTLVWDRLPMTIVFITFFAQVYSWYINKKAAKKIWFIGLLLGIFSVWYWHYTETISKGDLRLYALVQYLPMLLMVIIVSLHYKKQKALTQPFMLIALFYFIAKIFENFDAYIFQCTYSFGGHPLKHIAAAIASFYIIGLIKKSKIGTT